jgi:hypothetical protein
MAQKGAAAAPADGGGGQGQGEAWSVEAVTTKVVGERQTEVAGVPVRYAVYRWGPGPPADVGCYDREGTIYIWEGHLQADARRADLTAFHEHVELGHKAAGRAHAYAHRRALLAELLAAKALLTGPGEFRRYLEARVRPYPAWKVRDPEGVIDQLEQLLAADRPRRGELLRVITENRM